MMYGYDPTLAQCILTNSQTLNLLSVLRGEMDIFGLELPNVCLICLTECSKSL